MPDPSPEELLDALLAGDRAAWPALWTALAPRLDALIRRPSFLGRLSRSEDDCRNIALEVMAALEERDFARLRRFAAARAARPGLPLWPWLMVVAKRLAIDYLRRHDQYVDRRGAGDGGPRGAWVPMVTLPSLSRLPGVRPGMTDRGTAAELLALAQRALTEAQQAALIAWLGGADYDEIARDRGLGSGKDAERLLRAGLERLRRCVRDQEGP